MGSFYIWYSVVIVILIILLFILGLFTQFSPLLMMVFMLVIILSSFIVAAIYSGSAAGKTGGKNVDDANRNAHNYYVTATIIGWVTVGVIVLAIILVIYLGAEAGAASQAALAAGASDVVNYETKNITNAQVKKELSLPVANTPEARESTARLEKTGNSRGFFERLSENQKSAAKGVRGFLYFILASFIILAIVAGIYAAIGSGIQQGSEYKKGLKPGTISAIINLFVAGMFIVFFIVMYAKDRNIHKRLKEDIMEHHEFVVDYSKSRQVEVNEAKANIITAYIERFAPKSK